MEDFWIETLGTRTTVQTLVKGRPQILAFVRDEVKANELIWKLRGGK